MIGWEESCMVEGAPGKTGYESPAVGELAVVTGGSGNLGPVWIETFRGLGYRVHNLDFPQYDVTDEKRMTYAADRCMAVHGVPAVIVLNAAIDNPPGSVATFHGNIDRIIDVNIKGAVLTIKPFLPAMIKEGRGVIVGIVSIMGRIGADWRTYPEGFEKPCSYGMSKAALEQYARSLTVQYGRYGIRACCIGFGCYDSGKVDPVFAEKYLRNVPLGRMVSYESAKAALTFAVTCPEFAGQTAMVEGGFLSW